jgi:hypothetical protein
MRIKFKTPLIIIVLSIVINISTLAQVYSNTTIFTPRLTQVSALLLTANDMTQPEKDNLLAYWLWYYDNRIYYQGDATYSYNCHAKAWWLSEGHSEVWLNDPSSFWEDDSYIEVASQTNASKVSFGTADHSAITTGTPDNFISKWGASPLFVHNVEDCPYDNSDLHYYTRPYLSGNTSLLCSSGSQYTINNLTPECSITWACSGNISRVSAQGSNPCTFQGGGSGDGWIEATITSSIDAIVLPRINLWVGMAQVQSISGPSSASTNAYYAYYANTNHTSGTSYQWSVSPSGPYLSPSGGEVNSCAVVFYSTGYYQLVARAVNACGTTSWCLKNVYVGGKKLSLSPNPAANDVTITMNEDPLIEIANDTELSNSFKLNSVKDEPKKYTIRIYNSQSALLLTTIRSGKSFNVPLSNLQDGTYIIEVSEGNNRYTQHLIVKHN